MLNQILSCVTPYVCMDRKKEAWAISQKPEVM